MKEWLQAVWYRAESPPCWLKPLEALFRRLSASKRDQYLSGRKPVFRAPVPVIIVGNITVGGTGKTPVVLWLIETLKVAGYKPGVISRGYGAEAPYYPYVVSEQTEPAVGGDEPCMIVRRTGCPLVIDPNRPAAASALLEQFDCDLIISDDGLQHYALARDIELVVVDAKRGLGNGHCLPAGPLREPASRLERVDFVIHNGSAGSDQIAMQLAPSAFVSLDKQQRYSVANWSDAQVHAVAGIGNPQRFFDTLRSLGVQPTEHAFADHHPFQSSDLEFEGNMPVVMTEKDAVKISHFENTENCWYLEVVAQLPESFRTALLHKLETISQNGRK